MYNFHLFSFVDILFVLDHKISVDQTKLPAHLDRMLQLLVEEESTSESGISGPAMEYLLHHRILETLYTLARTDVNESYSHWNITWN